MTFRKKVFVSQKISLLLGGQELKVQALVSSYGAKYVFEESELPSQIRNSGDSKVDILYHHILAHCRVVKEITSTGTVYSLRFENPSSLLLRQIERDVEKHGLPSPWRRGLPRLSAEAKHLPVPVLAILERGKETLFLNVKNFTLGGLLLEYVGPALDEVKFGAKFNFDLVTNAGDKISDLSGLVTNVALESNGVLESSRTLFGLRLLPMEPMAKYKYRALIKEHCLGLKENPEIALG
jgi:hypothetical protein